MSLGQLFNRRRGGAVADEAVTSPGHGEFEDVAPYYDHLMRTVPYARWVDYVESLLDQQGVRPRRVLDLCCGTGKVGSEMLRRGYDVVGADLSEPMVRRCGRQSPCLPAAVMDAGQLAVKASCFDLVVSLYDSLNYILEPDVLAECFRQVYAALRAPGLFIFDLNTPRALSTGLFTQSNLGSSDPLQYRWQAHWIPQRRLCRVDMWFQWRDQGQERTFEETHWQYAHQHEDVLQMLGRAGFEDIAAFHAYTHRPPTRSSDRIYYVARKE